MPERAQAVQLTLINTIGAEVAQFDLGNLQQYNYEMDVIGFSTGLYTLQMTTGETQISKRIVIE